MSPLRRKLLAAAACAGLLPLGAGAAAWAYPTSVPVARVGAWVLGAEYLGREGVRIQEGASDCGIAALGMVFDARGVPGAALEPARAEVLRRGEGATLLDLQRLARASGLRAEGWRMTLAELARSPLPAVVHLPDHFVVVDRVTPQGVVELRDPGLGRLRMPASEFAELWTGQVLIVSDDKKSPES